MSWQYTYCIVQQPSQENHNSLVMCCYWNMVYDTCALSLTHWGWGKMATISQTKFSSGFSWIKMLVFCLKFHWNLFLSNHIPSKVWDEMTYPFPNFNGATVEVWKEISNFIIHFTMNVITYPCWGWNWSMLVKWGLRLQYLSRQILDHCFSQKWHRKLKSFLSKIKDLLIFHCQHYSWYLWLGDAKSQGISSYDVDLV